MTPLAYLCSVPIGNLFFRQVGLRVHALVPAAGRGERFGSAKLLAKWQDRELLAHVLLTLAGARAARLLSDTFVVHRPEDEAIPALALEFRAVPVAVRTATGELSDSLRAGIEAIDGREQGFEPSALLICLGDQPLLRVEVIRALIEAWGEGGVTAARPFYRASPEQPGHPFLLDRSLWRLAVELRGDSGFAPVLAHRGIVVRTIPVGGRNPDVDTPADLGTLEERESAARPDA